LKYIEDIAVTLLGPSKDFDLLMVSTARFLTDESG